MAHKHKTTCPIPDEICAQYKEQQRIVRLLMERMANMQNRHFGYDECKALIELIKGENVEL
jgi:hypothetical protein